MMVAAEQSQMHQLQPTDLHPYVTTLYYFIPQSLLILFLLLILYYSYPFTFIPISRTGPLAIPQSPLASILVLHTVTDLLRSCISPSLSPLALSPLPHLLLCCHISPAQPYFSFLLPIGHFPFLSYFLLS